MSSTAISAHLGDDSELMSQFEQYREEHNFTSKSEALRHILREHLDTDTEPQKDRHKSDVAPQFVDGQVLDAIANHRFILYSALYLLVADQVQSITILLGPAVSSVIQISILVGLLLGLAYQQVFVPVRNWSKERDS
jgi:metal-responsive CopG/Arc/MetJ family transcriptional regulator